MPTEPRFRLLTPDGFVTYDTFVLAFEQPTAGEAHCMSVVHEATGRELTVHRTRLVPVDETVEPARDHPRLSACLRCGRVPGVADDEVTCPYHGRLGCGLLEPHG